MSAAFSHSATIVMRLLLVLAASSIVGAGERAFDWLPATDGQPGLRWNAARIARLAEETGAPFRVAFPLETGQEVILEIEPFRVTTPSTRFVLGRIDGPDVPLDFDPAELQLFRGVVAGREGSSVFLAFHPLRSTGFVDLGAGAERYGISTASSPGGPGDGEQLALFRAVGAASLPPDVPVCATNSDEHDHKTELITLPSAGATPGPHHLRQIELAVETDHEFFLLFDDATDAALYLTQLYAEVSAIYTRDVGARVDLVYVRLWDQPEDLFNDVEPSPLPDFRSYWNANMGSVERDVAQLLSGRRDYPFGGQAYLSALCGSNGYGVVGYAMGSFPDPDRPSPYHYDISVTAHELGHNAGTGHTQNNGIDTCDDPATTAQRGTVMSYCGQTWSGGNANRDHYFHSVIQQNIESHVAGSTCVVLDCNGNGIDDDLDISAATSPDANSNGVPDECEDCNTNSILDPLEISAGSSLDLDGNGIPDECDPDCDGDSVPDAREIADGTSVDLYGNDIPDECEADCDANGSSDYSQIQGDITLDVDRNRILDSCQDCDGDGTPDLAALGGAHEAWVASGLDDSPLRRFTAVTGVLTLATAGPGPSVQSGQDVVITPDGRVLVSSAGDHRVMQFDLNGSYLGDLVPSMSGGLNHPTGLLLLEDGTLLVASRDSASVLRFDAGNGAPLGSFVAAGSGGLSAPFGLARGQGGKLYVSDGSNQVLQYDGISGGYVGTFVAAANNGGLLDPRGMTFKPDGNLLVASFGSDEVLEYEALSGAPLGRWAQGGTATRLTQVSPWGIRVGPNGNVFVIRTGEDFGSTPSSVDHDHEESDIARGALHLTNAQIYEFDVRNGNFIRAYIAGHDHGLLFPTGFDFVPGWSIDCNLNLLPDSCDIASASSLDDDLDGIPDECELDCNGNGTLDRLDVLPYGAELDCNYNLLPDSCDIASTASQDCDTNGVPDECEISDSMEFDAGWTVGAAGDTATAGHWIRVDPVRTGAQPEDDHTPGSGSQCFVTGQGVPGGSNNAADVDDGRTTLISPLLDLSSDADAELSYWRWYSNATGGNPAGDLFTADISNDDGQSWTNLETVDSDGPGNNGGWVFRRFRVADFVAPTELVRIRFVAEDGGGDSVVEAAIDDFDVIASCSCVDDAPEVAALSVAKSPTRLSWSDAGAGLHYDIAGGEVGTLQLDAGASGASCLADDLNNFFWDDPRPQPAAGTAYYYLVRAQKTCSTGSYGSSSSGGERLPVSGCP